jgi:hypothetical protein
LGTGNPRRIRSHPGTKILVEFGATPNILL